MSKKILLADDSITIQKVVELTFSDGDYEVIAVNNGARAIQKLSEMRPDIILSDIIMPEKNGYEVCEFVKSHPEYRNIPVVLLTGTFEPFDPDRADKAGCDAVVTKPFESQSLIHKVEELIEQARASAPAPQPVTTAAPSAPAPAQTAAAPVAAPQIESSAASPWADEPVAPSASDPAPGFRHANDIFASAPNPPGATTEMPFAPPPPAPPAGETRAFPAGSFDAPTNPATTQQFAAQGFESAPAPEPEQASPWDTPAPTSGETRAFPKMNFEELQKMAGEKAAEPSDVTDDSPFGAPPAAEQFSGETRAFPKMNFSDMQKMAEERSAPTPPPAPEPAVESPWSNAPVEGETRAFPQMNFDQLSQAASEPAPPATDLDSPWGQPAESSAPAWDASPAPPPPAPLFEAPAPEPQSAEVAAAWDEPAPVAAPEAEASPAAASESAAPAFSAGGNGLDLDDDQIDRIARRVVQLMSDQVVRNIAWEVIPDMAEMVVKERIRQLESEG